MVPKSTFIKMLTPLYLGLLVGCATANDNRERVYHETNDEWMYKRERHTEMNLCGLKKDDLVLMIAYSRLGETYSAYIHWSKPSKPTDTIILKAFGREYAYYENRFNEINSLEILSKLYTEEYADIEVQPQGQGPIDVYRINLKGVGDKLESCMDWLKKLEKS